MFGFVKQSTHEAAIAAKDAEIAGLAYRLVKEEERANRIAGRLLTAESQAATARIERDTAQRERDSLEPDALKYRRVSANLIPGGPKAKAKREAALSEVA